MVNRIEAKPRLRGIVFEREDGTARYLVGEEARRWQEQVDAIAAVVGLTHFYLVPRDFMQFPWQEGPAMEVHLLFEEEP